MNYLFLRGAVWFHALYMCVFLRMYITAAATAAAAAAAVVCFKLGCKSSAATATTASR